METDATGDAEAADAEAAEEEEEEDPNEPAHSYRLVICLKRNPRNHYRDTRKDEDILPHNILKKTRIIIVEFTVQGGLGKADPRKIFKKLLAKDAPLYGMNQKESFPESGDNDFKAVVTKALESSKSYVAEEEEEKEEAEE